MTDRLVCTLPPLTPTPTCTVCSAYSAFSNHPHLLRLSPPAHLVIIGPSPPRCVLTPRCLLLCHAIDDAMAQELFRFLECTHSACFLIPASRHVFVFFLFFSGSELLQLLTPRPPCRHIHLFYYFLLPSYPSRPRAYPLTCQLNSTFIVYACTTLLVSPSLY